MEPSARASVFDNVTSATGAVCLNCGGAHFTHICPKHTSWANLSLNQVNVQSVLSYYADKFELARHCFMLM